MPQKTILSLHKNFKQSKHIITPLATKVCDDVKLDAKVEWLQKGNLLVVQFVEVQEANEVGVSKFREVSSKNKINNANNEESRGSTR